MRYTILFTFIFLAATFTVQANETATATPPENADGIASAEKSVFEMVSQRYRAWAAEISN